MEGTHLGTRTVSVSSPTVFSEPGVASVREVGWKRKSDRPRWCQTFMSQFYEIKIGLTGSILPVRWSF